MQIHGRNVFLDVYLHEFPPVDALIDAIDGSLAAGKLNVVERKMVPFGEERAFTLVYVLQESHFVVHTFPERLLLSVDCYTCGKEGNPIMAVAHVLSCLDVREANIRMFSRCNAQ